MHNKLRLALLALAVVAFYLGGNKKETKKITKLVLPKTEAKITKVESKKPTPKPQAEIQVKTQPQKTIVEKTHCWNETKYRKKCSKKIGVLRIEYERFEEKRFYEDVKKEFGNTTYIGDGNICNYKLYYPKAYYEIEDEGCDYNAKWYHYRIAVPGTHITIGDTVKPDNYVDRIFFLEGVKPLLINLDAMLSYYLKEK